LRYKILDSEIKSFHRLKIEDPTLLPSKLPSSPTSIKTTHQLLWGKSIKWELLSLPHHEYVEEVDGIDGGGANASLLLPLFLLQSSLHSFLSLVLGFFLILKR
jgi:hypothetical protein